jgi:hypothetical protein
MVEELSVAADGSKTIRSGGQKQQKSVRIIHFRRKSPWRKELKTRKRFLAEKRVHWCTLLGLHRSIFDRFGGMPPSFPFHIFWKVFKFA